MKKLKNLLIKLTAGVIAFSMVAPMAVFAEEEEGERLLSATEIIAATGEFPSYTDNNSDASYQTSAAVKVGLKKYSDVKDKTLEETLIFLNELDIIEGYEDGTFRPNIGVNRAEAAYIALRVMNCKDVINDGTTYYDVDESHVLYNSIMTASSLGIATGYGDGNFRPNQPTRAGELVVMMMRALGYETKAYLSGGYYMGYIALASEVGVTLPKVKSFDDYITRADAAKFILDVLQSPVSKQISFGDDVSYDTNKKNTALAYYHNIYEAKGQMIATDISGINVAKTSKGFANIGKTIYKLGNTAFREYLGYALKFYYRASKDDDIGTVVYAKKQIDVKEIEIKAKDFKSYTTGKIQYYDAKENLKSVTVKTAPDVIKNGVQLKGWNKSVFDITNGSIKLISNDGGNVYGLIIIETFTNLIVSSMIGDGTTVIIDPAHWLPNLEVDADDPDINIELYDATGAQIDFDIEGGTTYNADGVAIKSISLPPIPTYAVISVFADKNEKVRGFTIPSSKDLTTIKIKISDKTVTGTLESMDIDGEGIMIIDGVEYNVAKPHFLFEEDRTLQLGMQAKFSLDIEGNIVDWNAVESDSNWEYAYLIKAATSGVISTDLQMRYMDSKGKFITAKTADKVSVNGKTVDGAKALSMLKEAAKLTNREIQQLIKLRKNKEGTVTYIQTITANYGIADGYPSDQLYRDLIRVRENIDETIYVTRQTFRARGTSNFGLFYDYYGQDAGSGDLDALGVLNMNKLVYQQPTVRFFVPPVESENEEKFKVNTHWKEERPKSVEVYDVDMMRKPAAAVIYEDAAAASLNTGNAFFIKTEKALDEDGMPVTYAYFEDGIKPIKLKLESEDALGYDLDEYGRPTKYLVPGDLVQLFGSDGVLSGVTMRISLEEVKRIWKEEKGISRFPEDRVRFDLSEAYLVQDQWVRIGRGDVDPETGVRKSDSVFYYTTNRAQMASYGIVYNEIDRVEPEIRTASVADIRPAMKNGFGKASLMYTEMGSGEPYTIAIYNFAEEFPE